MCSSDLRVLGKFKNLGQVSQLKSNEYLVNQFLIFLIRCYVDEVLPSCKSQFYDPSQKIRAVLFDYEGRLRTFERKQLLPLTRAFLSVPVQKTIGKIDCKCHRQYAN